MSVRRTCSVEGSARLARNTSAFRALVLSALLAALLLGSACGTGRSPSEGAEEPAGGSPVKADRQEPYPIEGVVGLALAGDLEAYVTVLVAHDDHGVAWNEVRHVRVGTDVAVVAQEASAAPEGVTVPVVRPGTPVRFWVLPSSAPQTVVRVETLETPPKATARPVTVFRLPASGKGTLRGDLGAWRTDRRGAGTVAVGSRPPDPREDLVHVRLNPETVIEAGDSHQPISYWLDWRPDWAGATGEAEIDYVRDEDGLTALTIRPKNMEP